MSKECLQCREGGRLTLLDIIRAERSAGAVATTERARAGLNEAEVLASGVECNVVARLLVDRELRRITRDRVQAGRRHRRGRSEHGERQGGSNKGERKAGHCKE